MLDEKKKYIVVGLGLCVLLMAACFWICGGKKLPDNGAGVESIGEQLDSAAGEQREITERIKSAEDRTQNIQGGIEQGEARIDNATERVENIERSITSTGELIAECQRILENVRRRGEEKAEGN